MSEETSAAVKSADRALAVLEHLASAAGARSFGEIADALEIPKSSLHGLLRNLKGRGWLSIDDSQGGVRYRVGPRALTVGAAYLRSDDIVRRSEVMLDRIAAELGETVHLGVLEGMEVIYLAKRDARHNLRLASGVGVRIPAYAAALGKVLMAELAPEVLDQRLTHPRTAMTSRTLVDEAALRADLEATRDRGYAIDDQESTEGVRCFAVSLGEGHPRTYAVSCSVPLARLGAEMEARVLAALREGAAAFSEPEGARLLGR